MNDRRRNEDREALIAGDRAGALTPDEAADLALLADVLADPSSWADPGAGLEDSVVAAVLDAPAEAPSPPRRAARRDESRRRRMLLGAVGIAAAIAIVVGLVVATRGRGSGPDFTATLNATALAPGSRASADVTRTPAGFRITLDAHRLPALRPGQYYQAWLKNDAGVLVPVGTFSSSDGQVTLWSGVSPKDFPTITVTIEATDNDQSSSGRRVLVGEVHAG